MTSTTDNTASTLDTTRKRFSVLGALAVLSLVGLLPVATMYIRSYFVSDNWKNTTNVSHRQFRTGEGGVEYMNVSWPDQVSQTDLTNGWEHDSFDSRATWLAKPLGSREYIYNFAGFQYNKAVPSRGGGGGNSITVAADVTAPFTRLRMPYWPLLITFMIFPLIWLTRSIIRSRRA